MKTALRFLLLASGLLGASLPARAYSNLLANAYGQDGNMSGWTVEANGGNGWHVATDYGGVMPGCTNAFITSYGWDVRSQTVDLLAAGYSAAQLDAEPTIVVTDWVRGYFNFPDPYFINVQLLDASHGLVSEWSYGTQASPKSISTSTWTEVTTNLTHYGAGVRYVVFRDGGRDKENWANWYGAAFDASSVTLIVQPVPEPSTLAALGLGALGILSARKARAKRRS
jgi:hypothetical protein